MAPTVKQLAESYAVVENAINDVAQLPGLDGPIGSYARWLCRAWAGSPGYRLINALGLPTSCTPYLASIGRGTPSYDGPPFQGGQCAVNYTVSFDIFQRLGPNGNEGVTNSPVVTLAGPLTLTRGQEFYHNQNAYGTQYPFWNWEWRTNGQVVRIDQATELQNIQVSRQDGQPDDCGNGPETFVPGSGYGGEQFGDTFTENGFTITTGDFSIDADGNISLPVNIKGPELGIDGVDLDFGTGGGAPEVPLAGSGTSGSPIDTPGGSGEGDVPDGPNGEPCVAIAFEMLESLPGNPELPGTVSAPAYPRVMGNLSLKLTNSDGAVYWGSSNRLNYAKGVFVIPNDAVKIVGYSYRVIYPVQCRVIPIYQAVS